MLPGVDRYRPLSYRDQEIGVPLGLESPPLVLPTLFKNMIRHLKVRCIVTSHALWVLSRQMNGSFDHILEHLAEQIRSSMPQAHKTITIGQEPQENYRFRMRYEIRTSKAMIDRHDEVLMRLLKPLASGSYSIPEFLESHAECLNQEQDGVPGYGEEDCLNIGLEEGSHWARSRGRLIVQADEALLQTYNTRRYIIS
ncbi:hypothetical protein ABW20_dc0102501 [Dactylellina cionopaga]|nr:hypothetical protein ABW20_dc0102501 [Dactylellina cionopaga]